MNLSMADRVCRLGDDLAFVKPSDAKLSPAMSYQYDTAAGYSAGSKRMARQFEGNYCWLVTIAPARTELVPDVTAQNVNSGFAPPPTPAPVANPWTPSGGWTAQNAAPWTTRQYCGVGRHLLQAESRRLSYCADSAGHRAGRADGEGDRYERVGGR